MRKIPASELQRNPGGVQDAALVEPIAITRNGRERLVLLSIEEYRRLTENQRKALPPEELSDENLEALLDSIVPPGFEGPEDGQPSG
jgi:prevent-host-death family protein